MSAASFKPVHSLPYQPRKGMKLRTRLHGWRAAVARPRVAVASVAVITFALVMTSAGHALAGDTLAGSGNNACESYLASDDDARLASDSWVLGFLSSANLRARNLDLLANQSNGTIIEALEGYCESHPDALVADAAVELLKSLADSAGGECTGPAGAAPPRGKLSICHTAGALDSNPEPEGFSVTIPGVE